MDKSIGIYLTKAVADIFDIMEKMNIKKVSKIITQIR